jgi:mono/diheme cytochrome c family protein
VNGALRCSIGAATAAVFFASVLVMAEPAQDGAAATLPEGEGAQLARTACLACHGSQLIAQQRLSRDGWLREIDKMVAWGASVSETERPVLAQYLDAQFPDRRAPAASADTADAGARVLEMRCTSCHGVDLVEQQRLDAVGWSREADKMIGWGAVLPPDEKTALVDYLARRFPPRR